MLDFVFGLERLVAKWPANPGTGKELTVTQIAEATVQGVAVAVDALAVALNKELDVQDVITLNEATQALKVLQERLAVQIQARARKVAARRDAAIKAYDSAQEKVRALQITKNWRNAYRTLTYFVGVHETDLPADLLVSLYGDLLRLGGRADANLQELGLWLRKGIQAALANPSKESMLDALDFIDAYSEHFIQHSTGQGDRVLASVVGPLAEPASRFELHNEWQTLAAQLNKVDNADF